MSRFFVIVIAMLMAGAAAAQTAGQTPQSAPPQTPAGAATQAPPQLPAGGMTQQQPLDSTRQMRLDLDQMDSLLNNMSAQVNFIRDTNMSILLNTNVRLWSVLIRDMRMQLQEQERAPKNTGSPQRH